MCPMQTFNLLNIFFWFSNDLLFGLDPHLKIGNFVTLHLI